MNERQHGSTPLDPGVERLLSSLTGVHSAHVVAGPEGTLREIHILATADIHPKQVVRNVESALSAGLGIEIDRRIVSVAQVRHDGPATAAASAPLASAAASRAPAPGSHEDRAPADAAGSFHSRTGTADARVGSAAPGVETPATGPSTPAAAGANGEAAAWPRAILLGYDARVDGSHRATCRVTLQIGPHEVTGEGQGADTPRGRAEAAAQAVFAALARSRADDRLGLEGVAIVEANGAQYVLVAARALDARRPVPLTGAALLDRSAEEAAILASLQATNRWRAKL